MRNYSAIYNCRVQHSKMFLFIEHWHVATYPLTYMPQDCVEEFCESVGWEFLECQGGDDTRVDYTFRCKLPEFTLMIDVICKHADRMNWGLE